MAGWKGLERMLDDNVFDTISSEEQIGEPFWDHQPNWKSSLIALVLMWAVSLVIASCCCLSVRSEEVIAYTRPVGGLIALQSDTPVGWEVEGRVLEQLISRDKKTFVSGTGGVGQFTIVTRVAMPFEEGGVTYYIPTVVKRYQVTVLDSVAPVPPGPKPPPSVDPNKPIVVPPDVRNDMGVGHEIYKRSIVLGVSNQAEARWLQSRFLDFALAMEKQGDQQQTEQQIEILLKAVNDAFKPRPQWGPVLDVLDARMPRGEKNDGNSEWSRPYLAKLGYEVSSSLMKAFP
jgi:hypothetical protein